MKLSKKLSQIESQIQKLKQELKKERHFNKQMDLNIKELKKHGRINTTNPEYSGRYHIEWLNMMYPRLRLAKNLLSDDGVIFISIDDNEVHNLRKICDEIFGKDNFVACIV